MNCHRFYETVRPMPQNHEISVIDPKAQSWNHISQYLTLLRDGFLRISFLFGRGLDFNLAGQARLRIESLVCWPNTVGEWNVLCVLSSLRVGDSIRAVKTVIKWARGWNKISDRNSREFKPKDLPSHTHIHRLNRWTKDFTNLQDFSIFGRISRLLKFWNPKMGFLI